MIETETLRRFICERFNVSGSRAPDLVLVDGGKAQVGAAVRAIADCIAEKIPVVGAVKPKGKHSEISHFVTGSDERVDFDSATASLVLLKQLRDEAHAIANTAHRQSRDMAHFYEWAALLPSLDERERQKLKKAFGTIGALMEADEAGLSKLIDRERIAALLVDIERYRRGDTAKVLPLIVPLRFDDPNGKAGDLRPITTAGFG